MYEQQYVIKSSVTETCKRRHVCTGRHTCKLFWASADGSLCKFVFSCGCRHARLKPWLRSNALSFDFFSNWSNSCNMRRKIANSWWNLSLSKRRQPPPLRGGVSKDLSATCDYLSVRIADVCARLRQDAADADANVWTQMEADSKMSASTHLCTVLLLNVKYSTVCTSTNWHKSAVYYSMHYFTSISAWQHVINRPFNQQII